MTGPVYYLVWLVLGTLYPAYESFKAVKSRNAKHYVRWMMYWIVYAITTASESLLHPLLQFWVPFYSEIKIIFLLYLISSSTRGSSVIYKCWIHPVLCSNEAEIDLAITKLKFKSFQTAKGWIKTGIQRLGCFVTNTALSSGGGLVQQFQRSYSMVDLTHVGENKRLSLKTNEKDISEEEDTSTQLKSRLKHYRSEECINNPNQSYSSLRRWKSPEKFTNEKNSSAFSSECLLPSFDDQYSQFVGESPDIPYNFSQGNGEESLKREAQLEEIIKMISLRDSKEESKDEGLKEKDL